MGLPYYTGVWYWVAAFMTCGIALAAIFYFFGFWSGAFLRWFEEFVR